MRTRFQLDVALSRCLLPGALLVFAGTISSAAPDAYTVASLEKILDEGFFPVWSPDGERIAYTGVTEDSFEVYIMNTDGSGQQCLTCGKEALRDTGFRGQPYWHPSGEYITFVAETRKYPRKGRGVVSRPGIGRNNNVWIMNRQATRFWRMTDYAENWGVIRPSFSHGGTKLYWNEEFSMEKYPEREGRTRPGHQWGLGDFISRKGEELGAWRVKYADVDFGRGGPKLSNLHTVDPPEGFTLLEGSGFTPDDSRLVYSYVDLSEAPGGMAVRGDIYTTDLNGRALRRLTSTPKVHDENAVFSWDGKKIAWCRPVEEGLAGMPGSGEELYLMDSDGSEPKRLTFFTERGSDVYDPNSRQISEVHWSPDGGRLVFGHASRVSKRNRELRWSVWILTFEGGEGGDRLSSPPTPPQQPTSGPGGRDYPHRSVEKEVHGRGAEQFWLFQPGGPAPKSAPMVAFLHGFGAMEPSSYGAWIEHLVRRGSIVVYPRYQASLLTRPKQYTDSAIAAVKNALQLLGEGSGKRPQVDGLAVVGHSAGGILSANVAALGDSVGLPKPRALMIVEPGSGNDVLPLEPLASVDAGTLALVVVGEDDTLAGESDAKRIFDALSHLPAENRDYVRIRSDDHGDPPLVADHLMPSAASDDYASGRRRWRRPRMAERLEDSVNAIDFYGLWKLFDGLMDAAFHGRNREYALGDTPEQRFMGTWSDGTPVKELVVTDRP